LLKIFPLPLLKESIFPCLTNPADIGKIQSWAIRGPGDLPEGNFRREDTKGMRKRTSMPSIITLQTPILLGGNCAGCNAAQNGQTAKDSVAADSWTEAGRLFGDGRLERLKSNTPGLTVDLGAGLWAWPMPPPCLADFDSDGDLDILCGDYIGGFTNFENNGSRTVPLFAAGRKLAAEDGHFYTPTNSRHAAEISNKTADKRKSP
jgi:hypothetical protein